MTKDEGRVFLLGLNSFCSSFWPVAPATHRGSGGRVLAPPLPPASGRPWNPTRLRKCPWKTRSGRSRFVHDGEPCMAFGRDAPVGRLWPSACSVRVQSPRPIRTPTAPRPGRFLRRESPRQIVFPDGLLNEASRRAKSWSNGPLPVTPKSASSRISL